MYHVKFMIVDRQILLLTSANIEDKATNIELLLHMEGVSFIYITILLQCKNTTIQITTITSEHHNDNTKQHNDNTKQHNDNTKQHNQSIINVDEACVRVHVMYTCSLYDYFLKIRRK
jgi:hypothetical protein